MACFKGLKQYKTRKGKVGGADVFAIYLPIEHSPRQQWRGFHWLLAAF